MLFLLISTFKQRDKSRKVTRKPNFRRFRHPRSLTSCGIQPGSYCEPLTNHHMVTKLQFHHPQVAIRTYTTVPCKIHGNLIVLTVEQIEAITLLCSRKTPDFETVCSRVTEMQHVTCTSTPRLIQRGIARYGIGASCTPASGLCTRRAASRRVSNTWLGRFGQ